MSWLRRSSPRGAGSVVGVFDEIYSPSAARAREHLDRQHEQVVATPSPGDRLLSEGRVVIEGHVIGETDPIG